MTRDGEKTSEQLIHHYTREYYLHHLAGHQDFNEGREDLKRLTNIFRSYALALCASAQPDAIPDLPEVCDIGCGRGDLAKHLLASGGRVALVDYSQHAIDIAREFIGEHPNATFLEIDAATIGDYLARSSQDAVFMTDFTEHVSKNELRRMFPACRDILKDTGSLVIHTPEKEFGSVLTQLAVQAKHINLMDIAELQELMLESFPHAEAFTWNGVQRFERAGQNIELFGVASKSPPKRTVLADSQALRFAALTPARWQTQVLVPAFSPPACFALRFTLEITESSGDVPIQVLFRTDKPEDFFWTGFTSQSLIGEQAEILLASPTLNSAGAPQWNRVCSLEIRGKPATGSLWSATLCDLAIASC